MAAGPVSHPTYGTAEVFPLTVCNGFPSVKRTYKNYELSVTAAGQAVTGKFELEKTVKRVVGIAMTADRPDLLIYRGSQRINIGGSEVIPEGHESKMLYPGVNVKPEDKYLTIDEAPGNGIIEVRYQDTPAGATVFAPYKVKLQVAYDVAQ